MALLIYGANGYTGALVAERAASKGVAAVLAGLAAIAITRLRVGRRPPAGEPLET